MVFFGGVFSVLVGFFGIYFVGFVGFDFGWGRACFFVNI